MAFTIVISFLVVMIAFTCRFGFEAVWLIVGWILGDMTAWIFVQGSPGIPAIGPCFTGRNGSWENSEP